MPDDNPPWDFRMNLLTHTGGFIEPRDIRVSAQKMQGLRLNLPVYFWVGS
jgi:hypothetical protein